MGYVLKFFSWKLFVLLFLIVFGFAFCYRVSETYGPASKSGCVNAIILTVSAAIAGFLPVIYTRTHEKAGVFFASVLIGAMVRMLITAAGILVVIYLLKQQRAWFLGWTAGFYVFFLALETGFVVYLLNKRHNENKGTVSDVNAVFAGKYESS